MFEWKLGAQTLNSVFDMIRNWSRVTPSEFERLCYRVLQANGFTNLKWFGTGGGDKGRDLLADKREEPLPGTERHSRWVVQCKRLTKRALSKTEVKEFLAAAAEHVPDSVLLIVSSTLTSGMKDWLKAVERDYRFAIYTWEEMDLAREVARHKMQLHDEFPELYATGDMVLFYAMRPNKIELSCNEFEEVFIVPWNVDSYDEAKAKAEEFVAFIKANDIVFE